MSKVHRLPRLNPRIVESSIKFLIIKLKNVAIHKFSDFFQGKPFLHGESNFPVIQHCLFSIIVQVHFTSFETILSMSKNFYEDINVMR